MDQYKMQDPRNQYPQPPFPKQPQPVPGLAKKMDPKPDHGEESYKGHGRLQGRRALITGADSGIGRAVAIAFAREGADAVLSYLPSEEPDAQEMLAAIKDTGTKAIPLPGDISDEAMCRKLVDTTVRELGGIDLLVNIAGEQHAVGDLAKIETKQLQSVFATNVYAMVWLCQAALEHMPAGSSIINTTSIQSYQPSAHLLDYAMTKAANTNFTHGLSQQLAPKGIRVNAVAPGPVWTPLQPSGGQPQDAIPEFGSKAPLGRPGQPVEVAPAYVYLASQESSFVTGEVIGVTGGQHLP